MFYNILLSLLPTLNYLNENLGKLSDYFDLGVIFLVLFALFSISDFILRKAFKKSKKESFVILFLASFSCFLYGVFCDFLGPYIENRFFKTSYLWGIFFVATFLFSWIFSKKEGLQKSLRFILFALISVNVFNISYSFVVSSKTRSEKELFVDKESYDFKYKPNVYYLLPDGYGRKDVLKRLVGFDNSHFISSLKSRGFVVGEKAFSNYHFTGASMSSTMNMRCHQLNGKRDRVIDRKNQMVESLRGNNAVRRIFRKNGYKVVNVPAGWHEMKCHGHEDRCIKTKDLEVYMSFIRSTPLRAFSQHVPQHYVNLADVKEAVHSFPDDPKFVYIHFGQVHDAVYDESGKYHSILHPIFSSKEDSVRYISSVRKMNREFLEILDYIREKDPKAIIIFQADHGPTYVGNEEIKDQNYWLNHFYDLRVKTPEEVENFFGVLCAAYIPEFNKAKHEEIQFYFFESPRNVDTFIQVFSYLSDLPLKEEKEAPRFLYYDEKKEVYKSVDISNLTKGL